MNLIRIDKGNTYTAYADGKRGETAKFDRPLLACEVEAFRKDPVGFLGDVDQPTEEVAA